jgi:hypothetical protein
MGIVVACLLLWLIGLGSLGMFFFDRLVKFEYENYKGYWEKDNKPLGYFWLPDPLDAPTLYFLNVKSFRATQKCLFIWIFVTPTWVPNDSVARFYLWGYRVSTMAIFSTILISIGLMGKAI